MRNKLLMGSLIALGSLAAVLQGCNGDHGAAAPAPPASKALDTAGVLALAHETSETNSPIAVNDGAVKLTDSNETATPLTVNAM